MIELFLNAWNALPDWSQIAALNLAKIVAILLPLILSVAYLTFA